MKKLLSLALCLLLCLTAMPALAEPAGDLIPLTIALPYANDAVTSTLTHENNRALAIIAENTGVSLTVRTYDDLYNTLMLMFAAGTEPDMVAIGGWIAGGSELQDMLVDQEAVIEFTDIVNGDPERWPLISSFMKEGIWTTTNKNLFGDPGRNLAVYSMDGSINMSGANVYYMPYLEAAGYTNETLPTTMDEFYEMLVAIKNTDVDGNGVVGDTIPWTVNTSQGTGTGGLEMFWKTRGITEIFGCNVEYDNYDSYVFYPTKEETKAVHKDIARYYTEGLLDPEFMTREYYANWTMMAAGQSAVTSFAMPNVEGSFYASLYDQMAQGGMKLESPADLPMDAVPLKGAEGDTMRSFMIPGDCGIHTFISHSCENPEAALDVLEYLYSAHGQRLLYFGEEGVTYELDENGEPQITDLEAFAAMYPETDTGNGLLGLAIVHNYSSSYHEFERDGFLGSMSTARRIVAERTEKTEAVIYGDSIANDYHQYMIMLPDEFRGVSVKGDEWDEISAALNDICWRYYSAWWTGQKDVDETWDAFVAECEAAGSVEYEAEYNRQLEEAKAALSA